MTQSNLEFRKVKMPDMEKNALETRQHHVAIFIEDSLRYPLMTIAFVVGMIFGLFAGTIEWLKDGGGRSGDIWDASFRRRFQKGGGSVPNKFMHETGESNLPSEEV